MTHENEEVIYIEYQDDLPFSVITAQRENGVFVGHSNWDFEPDWRNIEMVTYRKTGGGPHREIDVPNYIDGCEESCFYWVHPHVKVKGEPKNITKLLMPKQYNGESNPFKIGRLVSDHVFCKMCDKYWDDDGYDNYGCPDHQQIEDGKLIYLDGTTVE